MVFHKYYKQKSLYKCQIELHIAAIVIALIVSFFVKPVYAEIQLIPNITLVPTIIISEEFTDNVYETPTHQQYDFITQVRPGVGLTYSAPIGDANLNYEFSYRKFLYRRENEEQIHSLASRGLFRLINDFLFLDISDNFRRVALDVTRDTTSVSLFSNQTDENTASVSPYFLYHLGNKTTLKTGYRFSDIRYWDPAGIDRMEHRAFTDLTYEVLPRLTVTGSYYYNETDAQVDNFRRNEVSGEVRYEYADRSFIYGQIGNSWQILSSGKRTSNLLWRAGLTHEFNFITISLESWSRYTDTPLAIGTKETYYVGKIEKRYNTITVGFNTTFTEYYYPDDINHKQQRLKFTATTNYILLPNVTANLLLSGERSSVTVVGSYPYQFAINANLNIALKNNLSLNLNYIGYSSMYSVFDLSNSRDINRIIFEIKKNF